MSEMGSGFGVRLLLWSFEWMSGWDRPRWIRHDRGCYSIGISIYR